MNSRLIFFIVSFMIFLSSCEKEITDYPQGEKEVLGLLDHYVLRNCLVAESGSHYAGYKCSWGFTETCPKQISCRPMLDDNGLKIPLEISQPTLIGLGFTNEEIAQWINGVEFLNDTTPESILQRYEFYLYMWESGITLHPDTIIMLMEN